MLTVRTRLLRWIAAAMAFLAIGAPAQAHPHVWVTVETTLLSEGGAFVGLRHKWTFDEFYTAMAIEGLDKNKDGKYDREELAELAKVNIESLKDFAYFTLLRACQSAPEDGGAARLLARARGQHPLPAFHVAVRQPGAA